MNKRTRRLVLLIISLLSLSLGIVILYYIYDYTEITNYINLNKFNNNDPRYIETLQILNNYKTSNFLKQFVYFYPNVSMFSGLLSICIGIYGLVLHYNTKKSTIIFNKIFKKELNKNKVLNRWIIFHRFF